MAEEKPNPLQQFKDTLFPTEILSTSESAGTITVKCPTCSECGETASLTVKREGYEKWKAGEFIQRALPELSSDERELLMTGTHSACWDAMWAEEDEDDDA